MYKSQFKMCKKMLYGNMVIDILHRIAGEAASRGGLLRSLTGEES